MLWLGKAEIKWESMRRGIVVDFLKNRTWFCRWKTWAKMRGNIRNIAWHFGNILTHKIPNLRSGYKIPCFLVKFQIIFLQDCTLYKCSESTKVWMVCCFVGTVPLPCGRVTLPSWDDYWQSALVNFDKHVSLVCNYVNNQLKVMIRFCKLISTSAMLKLYKAFILPHFQCCSSVWHFCSSRKLHKLCGYQRPAQGGRPLGNPRGAHGLGWGFVAKMFPGDRGIGALLHFMASLLRDLPTGFANGLLSQSSAVISMSRGMA